MINELHDLVVAESNCLRMEALDEYISSGAAPPIPATEPRIVGGSCVKLFRKTFRSVFSNSFFVCLWASTGLEFGPPGASRGDSWGLFWASWAHLVGPWAPRSILSDFWLQFGPPFGVPNRPWNAPRATSRPILPSRRVPGKVPEGLWEVILGTFLWLGWRERKKGTKSAKKHRFLKLLLHAFSYRFRVYSVRLGARRRKSTT